MNQNLKAKLSQIFNQDKEERINMDWNNDVAKRAMKKHDYERVEDVKLLINKGLLKEADGEVYYQLSLIFQHGETPEDYWQAYEFAQKAFEDGIVGAGRMVANTLDRYLIHVGKPQKYGTQSRWNEGEKRYIQYPVDPETSDKERQKLHLPPLTGLKEEIKENTKFRLGQQKRKVPPSERVRKWKAN